MPASRNRIARAGLAKKRRKVSLILTSPTEERSISHERPKQHGFAW
jgi:hypothetical protein